MISPEIRMAQRILEKRNLKPPIDIRKLIAEYADVEFVDFPLSVDAVCLGLKKPGRRPRVLVQYGRPPTRERFTLAHELGHIIIPWHIGNKIDNLDAEVRADDEYYYIEAEANRFASELLLPSSWLKDRLLTPERYLDDLVDASKIAGVSQQVGMFKFVECLPANYIFAVIEDGECTYSQRSNGTTVDLWRYCDRLMLPTPFPFPVDLYELSVGARLYRLWKFKNFGSSGFPENVREWRIVLDEIVADIITDPSRRAGFKASVNGVAANANSTTWGDRAESSIVTAMIHRFHGRAANDEKYRDLMRHRLFGEFCRARAMSYLSKHVSR